LRPRLLKAGVDRKVRGEEGATTMRPAVDRAAVGRIYAAHARRLPAPCPRRADQALG